MCFYQEIYFNKHFPKVVNYVVDLSKYLVNSSNPKIKTNGPLLAHISFSNITSTKAYSKKEFEASLLYFGQSALMGPIDKETEKGREVAVALANRSAVHFEMEQW